MKCQLAIWLGKTLAQFDNPLRATERKRLPPTRTSTIKVEIIVNPVHFCCTAVGARVGFLNSTANALRKQARMNLARIGIFIGSSNLWRDLNDG
jgi:hypothetical protein